MWLSNRARSAQDRCTSVEIAHLVWISCIHLTETTSIQSAVLLIAVRLH